MRKTGWSGSKAKICTPTNPRVCGFFQTAAFLWAYRGRTLATPYRMRLGELTTENGASLPN
jgi:hypothetical protein